MVDEVKVATRGFGEMGYMCFPGHFFYNKAWGTNVTFCRGFLPESILGVEGSESGHLANDDVGIIF